MSSRFIVYFVPGNYNASDFSFDADILKKKGSCLCDICILLLNSNVTRQKHTVRVALKENVSLYLRVFLKDFVAMIELNSKNKTHHIKPSEKVIATVSCLYM